MSNSFVLCINNNNNPASLIQGKMYYTLPDTKAESLNMIRVIDEDISEPDGYLYPEALFLRIQVPESSEDIVRKAICHNTYKEAAFAQV